MHPAIPSSVSPLRCFTSVASCQPPTGLVRLEQKNDTFLEMGIYDDGPFEAGDENQKNPDLVPAAPNSYLGESELQQAFFRTYSVSSRSKRSPLLPLAATLPPSLLSRLFPGLWQ